MTLDDVLDGRPLTDPETVRAALRDTIPGPGPAGCTDLGFLLCDPAGHLVAPLVLPGLPVPDPEQATRLLDEVLDACGGPVAVAAFVVRHGPVHALPVERAYQEALQRGCRRRGVRDLGLYVVGTRGTAHVAPLELVD